MRRIALGVLVSGTLTVAAAQKATAEVAVVNGVPIQQSVFVDAMRERLAAGARDSAALREQVRKDLVVRSVLAQQGRQAKLDKSPGFQARVEAYRDLLLAQAWEAQWMKDHPPTTKQLEAEYQRVKKQAGLHEYRIRQVVVRDETSAQLVLDQIKAGKDLAELAKSYSIEPLGKSDGGLLPWVNLTVLVPALRDAVPQAKVGKVWADPVQGPAGWHVFRVEEQRPFVMPKLQDIQPQLSQAVMQTQLREAVQALLNQSKVELK